ncbi:hypothetical protein TNCV_1921501 [Trichonephila clavipes]|nr:hypothetical protein TNCV_1921501 [Trichonephila clavipes]
MRRLNLLSGHRSQAKGKVFLAKNMLTISWIFDLSGFQQAFGCFFPLHVVESKFIDMLCLLDGPFEIVQPRLFLMPMVFTKQNKHPFGGGLLVDDTSSDLALPSSVFQCIGFIGQRHGHHRGRKVLGKASIGSMTNEKCLKHLSLLYGTSGNRPSQVPTWMDIMDERSNFDVEKICMKSKKILNYTTSQYQHGWTITMDERLNFKCGNNSSLKTIVKSKEF